MSDAHPAELRLFIAIAIPQAVKDEIFSAQSELRRSLPSKSIRWTRPEQFHLTLKFLGNVATDRVQDLTTRLSEACSGFAPLQLRARGLGCFPNPQAPRVLWVGIEDALAELAGLQASVEAAASPFTAEPTAQRFTAHVTLARLGKLRRPDVETLAALVKPNLDFGRWTATEVELMRSELSPAGAIHSSLAQTPLLPRI